ncbi:MAG: hypothetical protein ACR2JB_07885 [Bryobacteraceae bacterium]
METTFKSSDDILKQLVTARREEVVRLQKSQAEHLKDLETRGQARIEALNKTLPKEIVAVVQSLAKTHDEATAATKSHVDKVKAKLAASGPSPENETAVHPGLARGHLVAWTRVAAL